MRIKTISKYLIRLAAVILTISAASSGVHAAGLFSGADVEKPNPQFTREGDRIWAKFIPRAKSTSVTLEFQVIAGGTVGDVKGVDFFTIDRPEVDIKNFKSAAFEIDVQGVSPGGTAAVALRSDFFSMSTAFYVFNPNLAAPWIKDAQKENRLVADRVREIVVEVKDGGDRDADGAVNGRIRLVGGPRDSFWGYALGTLFIRFFGIFFVLTLLMIGMFASGWVFRWLDRLREGQPVPAAPKAAPAAAVQPAAPAPSAVPAIRPTPAGISEATVAAIAAAVYLRDTTAAYAVIGQPPAASASTVAPSPVPGTAWSQSGRVRIMQERLAVFNQTRRR
ncbi:uncharacterized protein Dvar_64820 [Desulfosarcina variabilis str. Montpellier]|uniref:OadG family transporter subunit n=1 Tax=Desulfosarcina variabilis TaxID=2300 RepID=UPI003AFA43CE